MQLEEEEEEVAAMEVVALSRTGTLGQVCSSLRKGNLVRPCVIMVAGLVTVFEPVCDKYLCCIALFFLLSFNLFRF